MKTNTKINIGFSILLALVVLGSVILSAPKVYGLMTDFFSNTPTGFSQMFTLLNATTTTATSTNTSIAGDGIMKIAGAKRLQFYFTRASWGGSGGNSGNTQFKIQVSPDGSRWYDFNKLVQSTSTSLRSEAIVTGTTSINYGASLEFDAYKYVRCIAAETTDGMHTCQAYAEY